MNIHEQWKRNVTIAVEAMNRTCTNAFAARLRAAISLFFAMFVNQYAAAFDLAEDIDGGKLLIKLEKSESRDKR